MLQLTGLSCGYNDQSVVTIPALTVDSAEVVAIVGRSGGGKTTFLSTLDGSLPPLSGEILMDGKPVRTSDLRKGVARTIQSFPLLHWLSVRGNLKLAARMKAVTLSDGEIERLMKQFAASHLIDRFPKEMSGGERARASLAQAAIGQPKLLLLDEPLTGLDPIVKTEVAEALFGFARTLGATVLFVTHDIHDAIHYSNRVAALSPGPPSRIVDVFDAAEPNLEERLVSVLKGHDAHV